MRRAAIILLLLAGARPGLAITNTRISWQASTDNTSWSSSTAASPGQTVYVRCLVSYIGSSPAPVGLASLVMQPSGSNWDVTGTADTLLPFVNGGQGSNTSTPPGVVVDPSDPTQFGRLSPWGRSSLTSTSRLMGHLHVGDPQAPPGNWLRIAQAQATSWVGGAGNTSGAAGVPISQFSNIGRLPIDPAFDSELTDIVVFKFGIVVGDDANRTMTVGLAWYTAADAPPPPQVSWYASLDEAAGSIRGEYELQPATIVVVPAPTVMVTACTGLLMWTRRRR